MSATVVTPRRLRAPVSTSVDVPSEAIAVRVVGGAAAFGLRASVLRLHQDGRRTLRDGVTFSPEISPLRSSVVEGKDTPCLDAAHVTGAVIGLLAVRAVPEASTETLVDGPCPPFTSRLEPTRPSTGRLETSADTRPAGYGVVESTSLPRPATRTAAVLGGLRGLPAPTRPPSRQVRLFGGTV